MDNKLLGVKIPTEDKISSRTSTIAKSLATSIIPRIIPKEGDDLREQAKDFWTKHGKYRDGKLYCAYCSAEADQWDHFHPLVKGSKPTGYITEIQNLVPCCSSCNGSKGGKDWKKWLIGPPSKNASKHPLSRGVSRDVVEANRTILEEFENTFPANRLSIQNRKWFADFWKHYDTICDELKKAQNDSDEIKKKLL